MSIFHGQPGISGETCYKIYDYNEQVCEWVCESAEQPAEVSPQRSAFDSFMEDFGRVFVMRMRAGFNLGLFWSE